MSEIRGFDPSLVQRKHVFPKTFLYGNDAPGIKLRMERFEQVLRESGDNPSVYSNAADAIGYLSTGDMFSDDVCVVIKDVSDALKTSTESKHLYASLVRSIATYGDSSTIVLAAPMKKSTASLKSLIEDIKKLGGTVRSVIAPDSSNISLWLDEYAKSTGRDFTEEEKNKLISVSNGDVDVAKDIISAIGLEIGNLSIDEIHQWMDKEKEFSGNDIRAALMGRDIDTITSLRSSFGTSAAAYRTFLLKIRLNVLDLLIPAASDGAPEPLISYKSSQYANANGNLAYFIAREVQGNSDYHRLARIYNETNRQISNLAMSKDARIEDLLITIISD